MTDLSAEIAIKGHVDPSLTKALDGVVTSLRQSSQELTKLFGRWHSETAQATKDLSRLTSQTQKATGALTKLWRATAAEAGKAVKAVNTTGVLKRDVNMALTTEAALIRLRQHIGADDKDAAVAKAEQEANRMSLAAPISKAQFLDVDDRFNSAGVSSNAALSGTEVALKVAKITAADARQVADSMAGVYQTLGQSMSGTVAEKMGTIGDVMAKTRDVYRIQDFGQLGDGLTTAASAAASAQIRLQDVAMAVGQLNAADITGTRAGTAFSAVFGSMSKAARQLGFEIVRDTNGQMDYLATMTNLNTALSKYGEGDQRNTVLQGIFGDDGMEALPKLLKNLGRVKDDQNALGNSTGYTEKQYKPFANSYGGQVTIIGNAFDRLSESIGKSLLPVIAAVEPFIVSLVGGLADLITQFPLLGQAIGTVIAILGSAVTRGLLKRAWTLLRGKKEAAAGIGDFLATKFSAIKTELRGAMTGGWEFLATKFNAMKTGLSGAMTRAGTFLATKFSAITTGLSRAGTYLLPKLGQFAQSAWRVAGDAGKWVGKLGGPLLTALSYSPQLVDGIRTGNNTEIGGAVGGTVGTVAGGMAGATLGSVIPVVGTVIGGLVGGILGGMGGESLGQWIGGMFDDTKSADGATDQPRQVTNANTITITNTITQQPGQDPDALARALNKHIAEQARRAMYDAD